MSSFIIGGVNNTGKEDQLPGNERQLNGKLISHNANITLQNNPPATLSPLPEFVQNRRKSLLSNNFPSLAENSAWIESGKQNQQNGIFSISGNLPVRNGQPLPGNIPNGNHKTSISPSSPTETAVETINFEDINEKDKSPLFVRSTLTKRLSSDNLRNSIKTLRRNSTNSLFNVPNSKNAPSSPIEIIDDVDENDLSVRVHSTKVLERRNSFRCGPPRFVPEIMEDFHNTSDVDQSNETARGTVKDSISVTSKEVRNKASQEKKSRFPGNLLRLGSRSKISTDAAEENSNKPLPLQVEDLREDLPSPTVGLEKSSSTDVLQMQLNEINEGSLEEEELILEAESALATSDNSIKEEGAEEEEHLDRAHWMRLLPDHVKRAPLQHLYIPGAHV